MNTTHSNSNWMNMRDADSGQIKWESGTWYLILIQLAQIPYDYFSRKGQKRLMKNFNVSHLTDGARSCVLCVCVQNASVCVCILACVLPVICALHLAVTVPADILDVKTVSREMNFSSKEMIRNFRFAHDIEYVHRTNSHLLISNWSFTHCGFAFTRLIDHRCLDIYTNMLCSD